MFLLLFWVWILNKCIIIWYLLSFCFCEQRVSYNIYKSINMSRQTLAHIKFLSNLNTPNILNNHYRRTAAYFYICDRSEQKQPCGCTLTNPPHVTPLRPGSTFIDGFSKAIYQKIADFNSYPLRYQFWKSVYKCWAGTQWRIV